MFTHFKRTSYLKLRTMQSSHIMLFFYMNKLLPTSTSNEGFPLISVGAAWAYEGPKGPDKWPTLFPGCRGTRQSPINLDTSMIRYGQALKPFTLTRTAGALPKYTLINDGHKGNACHGLVAKTWQIYF